MSDRTGGRQLVQNRSAPERATMELNTSEGPAQFIELATDIVSAYVSNNSVGAGELPILIKDVYGALTRVTNPEAHAPMSNAKPAVSIKKSITPDYIICLED